MSRLGKKPLVIADKIKVKFENQNLEIVGPLGKIVQRINDKINLKLENGQIILEALKNNKESNIMLGLTRGLIKNNLIGVEHGFKKDLEVLGLGYKVALEGKNLLLQLGFSHPINYVIPEGIKVSIDKQNSISIFGIDKSLVGEVASYLHSLRPPEPYKGTGVKYVGEHIIRKAGKAAAGGKK